VVGEDPALEAAARQHFGPSVPVYRCRIERRRRVVGLLPAASQPGALQELRAAYQIGTEARARQALQTLARGWARQHPEAAEALRDGLADTLTLHRLGAVSKRRPRPSAEPRRPRARARP
jgi:transposase-like protein